MGADIIRLAPKAAFDRLTERSGLRDFDWREGKLARARPITDAERRAAARWIAQSALFDPRTRALAEAAAETWRREEPRS